MECKKCSYTNSVKDLIIWERFVSLSNRLYFVFEKYADKL